MKPGIKSTEFWTTVVGLILGGFLALGVVTPEQADTWMIATEKFVGAAIMLIPVVTYTIQRTKGKIVDVAVKNNKNEDGENFVEVSNVGFGK